MNNKPKVSVIIPVYEVEKYIERCARSLFEQTLYDIEFLFINDCTKDNSVGVLLRTLEDYPHRKPQVRIITMEQNSGQAAVRKRGMLEANGEYQIHCDSDDWVETDMYERMYTKALETGSDIVTCNYWREFGGGKSVVVCNLDNSDPHYHINYVKQNVWWTLWARLIRSSLIKKHSTLPIPGMNMWEDIFVNLQVYFYANSLSHIDAPLYHYDVSREGSIMSKRLEDSIIQQQVSCLVLLSRFFNEVGFDASVFLAYRKCRVKSKYLQRNPVDYISFQRCFPDVTICTLNTSYIHKIGWEMAARGCFFPLKTISFCNNLKCHILKNIYRRVKL